MGNQKNVASSSTKGLRAAISSTDWRGMALTLTWTPESVSAMGVRVTLCGARGARADVERIVWRYLPIAIGYLMAIGEKEEMAIGEEEETTGERRPYVRRASGSGRGARGEGPVAGVSSARRDAYAWPVLLYAGACGGARARVTGVGLVTAARAWLAGAGVGGGRWESGTGCSREEQVAAGGRRGKQADDSWQLATIRRAASAAGSVARAERQGVHVAGGVCRKMCSEQRVFGGTQTAESGEKRAVVVAGRRGRHTCARGRRQVGHVRVCVVGTTRRRSA
ncbi:hypothetical protein GGX14DRAFT_667786 [Mycena pura]|uniref:Uncharacterized protein n=1 Tax=Mycena pura TaxID=153505 RepID=A0AAD6UP18_9AGAR|nr:hypothetical protein GGX14DRAFT_409236 [Mycena pura]KAJ7197646.1 hypothetical protein GGX14DRAFT_667786 [Mycena pura]